ncbi:MAG: hypothetical protein B1H13_03720 [Desulfobacteraceae bacterium 4484_190.3]|nr:MAG: hypothetical protein B1H13_03720 [Desulfobacteraceae bacterium 4484_190.3]
MTAAAIESTPFLGHKGAFDASFYGLTNHGNHPLSEFFPKKFGVPFLDQINYDQYPDFFDAQINDSVDLRSFRPISALCSKNNPRNINYDTFVKSPKNSLFLDGRG